MLPTRMWRNWAIKLYIIIIITIAFSIHPNSIAEDSDSLDDDQCPQVVLLHISHLCKSWVFVFKDVLLFEQIIEITMYSFHKYCYKK